MTRKADRIVATVVLYIVAMIMALPETVLAAGEYDGIWVGQEIITIPSLQVAIDDTTETNVYQVDLDTLSLRDPLLGSFELVRSGSQWLQTAPIEFYTLGQHVEITSLVVTFLSSSQMTGTFTVTVLGATGSGSLALGKLSCQSLISGEVLSGLSGEEGSMHCYEIYVPPDATHETDHLTVQSWGGTGDIDLLLVDSLPPFGSLYSMNLGNEEYFIRQVTSEPIADKSWYVVVLGNASYSGLNLQTTVTITAPPVANFTADVFSGFAPLTVSFTDQSSGDVYDGFLYGLWDFGDGTKSVDQNPVHTYAQPGTYTVAMTVTGPGGTDVETKADYIVVNKIKLKSMPWLFLLLQSSNE